MRTIAVFLAATSAITGQALAQAQGQAQTPAAARFREVFLQLDANGDTVLERDEVPESGKAAFDRLLKRGDANKNGKLEADELRALGQKVAVLNDPEAAANRFKAMDKDGDGKLTRAEFTGIPANFDRMDADKDGTLTRDEMTRFARNATPGAAKAKAAAKEEKTKKDEPAEKDDKAKKDEKAKPASPPAKDDDETADPALRFKRLDKDGDGKISKDEFQRAKLFEHMDTNKDGSLSPEELAKFMKGPG